MWAEVEHLYFGKGNDPGRGKKIDERRTLCSKNLLCSPILFFLVCAYDFENVSVNFRLKLFLIFVL